MKFMMRLFILASAVLLISVNGFVPSKLSGSEARSAKSSIALQAFTKEELVQMTKNYVENPNTEVWDDDFVFRGPVIGPLVKKDLIATLGPVASNLKEAFPDLEANAFGFNADDPIEPNRVWYFVRPRGTFEGAFDHPVVGKIEPTGAKLIGPPEARSVTWTDEGKVKHQTVGYVTDRFTGDTTDGKGAVFGQYHVMGQNIDGVPGSPRLRFLQWLAEFLPGVPKSYSKKEDIPEWWTDPRLGADS
uniref:Uncharacterized protein n=1 Tax=Grammatophora oceanica TaxID=210454 RepID=A0A7S1VPF3_9STRA|mmetsp:Transcript_50373/g.75292  ORF Transcript_50373/g.75292 Transcript_50373/m.75292 type:complete len:246 (+) Transcript_50373:181-918(+)|eukprot:CAMPEP_0194028652 /NCGR_PEP_ID=MMETSP0009_2-20130614/2569_1 /TAXON_ID=210454 /ORGANISM="Grammatophora oceanica, Strain CCMP 410" /LENGTH=245 /DNA_ID=CAMNT_0038668099 /DNA_START=101 /DNA_END=838 /DNA_ORIENTATION=-